MFALKRRGWAAVFLGLAVGPACGQTPPAGVVPASAAVKPVADKPVDLVLEDQFGRKADIATLRGHIIVLVYGDRAATDDCRALGENLHILFHPTAKGQPADKARLAPVEPLAGMPAGKASPDVIVVPVAAAGSVPGVVKDLIRSSVKKASPDVPVWLDFTGSMQDKFGLKSGQPNIAVFDANGHLRTKINGTPDRDSGTKLVQAIQNLRAEAAGLNR
jgi:hypothetical protein